MKKYILDEILLLYHHPPSVNAPTIMEHVGAFEQHSRFQVRKVNTAFGFPKILKSLRFQIVVLHYSLFGIWPYKLDEKFYSYLHQCRSSYKVAFFQDEYRFCQQRFEFINHYQIDCVFTRVKPAYFKDTYQQYTGVSRLIHTLAGYVSDDLVETARSMTLPDEERKTDIGYRARRLSYYMGMGSQEKHEIASRFLERATGVGLKLDIETDPKRRIYGKAWYEFLANCRACLGVEGGVSIFDLEGVVYKKWKQIMASNPAISFPEFHHMARETLQAWENNIPYRSFTPRHFESAAFRVCQILFEGEYSGMMQPMAHYIPLKKDFSNFNDVIRMFKDKALRRELTENAYRDLVASGRYSYKRFINSFDDELIEAGLQPSPPMFRTDEIVSALNASRFQQILQLLRYYYRSHPFPGRGRLASFNRRLLKRRQSEEAQKEVLPWKTIIKQ